jgi:hypothetical protein
MRATRSKSSIEDDTYVRGGDTANVCMQFPYANKDPTRVLLHTVISLVV